MGGPGWLTGKGFVGFNDIGQDRGSVGVGGRVDLRKQINEIKFTASITDATARDYEAAPWLKDSIITAEKRLNGEFLTNIVSSSLASCTMHSDTYYFLQHQQQYFWYSVFAVTSCQMHAFFKHVPAPPRL